MMKKIIFGIIAAALFIGCEMAPTKPSDQSTGERPANSTPATVKEKPVNPAPDTVWDKVATQYNYFKDKRTSNVCIGMWQNDYRTIIYVPCDQVQHLLKNP